MRKLLIVSMSLVALLLVGCGGKKKVKEEDLISTQCFAGAPDWVIAGSAEGGLSGVGAHIIGKAGVNYARKMAAADAMDNMARNISVKVNNMVKSFTQSTGLGDEEVVDTVSANVSKQITSQELRGVRQAEIWESPCRELYVLMVADPASTMNLVRDGVTNSYKNDSALWQQFQAQKAQQELDAAIAQEFGR